MVYLSQSVRDGNLNRKGDSNMLKKLAAFLMAAAMLLTMTAAGAESAQAPVTISFYSTQAGVDDATIALLDEFMA